jgi:DNA polymerase III subunit epsilon
VANSPNRVHQPPGPQLSADNQLTDLLEATAARHQHDRDPAGGSGDCKPVELGALEEMAAALETSGRYRILRRLEPRTMIVKSDGTPTLRGIFLDVETTGLDPSTDEIVELAMVPFDFTSDGRIFVVHESFSRFRDPGRPIPAVVTALTGITDAMVAGTSFAPSEIQEFLGPDAVIIIAHNARFDRRFVEKFCSAFTMLPWACSWAELPWAEEGFDRAKLAHLAAAFGFFYDGHRAIHDCQAGVEILARALPRSGRGVLGTLLDSARQPRWRIWAAAAPFELKDSLKRRSYRWSDGSDGRPRAWYIDVPENGIEAEFAFLRREIYGRDDVDIAARRMTAFERYSDRV